MEAQLNRHAPADILGVPFDFVGPASILSELVRWKDQGRSGYVTFANPSSVMLCRRDKAMKEATLSADLTLPDGIGIVMAARLLGMQHAGRVTGPSTMLYLCDHGRKFNLRHYFLGGAEGVAEKLARRLERKYPGLQVAGCFSPPFRSMSESEDTAMVARINRARPDLVWIGLGAPKQEKWMHEHHGRIDATAMLGVGAAFDFHSGNVPWAPPLVRRFGLEWAYRFLVEPKRMFKRNLDSPRFLATAAVQAVHQRIARAVRGNHAQPSREMLDVMEYKLLENLATREAAIHNAEDDTVQYRKVS